MKDLKQKCESQPVNIRFKAIFFFHHSGSGGKVNFKVQPLLVFYDSLIFVIPEVVINKKICF